MITELIGNENNPDNLSLILADISSLNIPNLELNDIQRQFLISTYQEQVKNLEGAIELSASDLIAAKEMYENALWIHKNLQSKLDFARNASLVLFGKNPVFLGNSPQELSTLKMQQRTSSKAKRGILEKTDIGKFLIPIFNDNNKPLNAHQIAESLLTRGYKDKKGETPSKEILISRLSVALHNYALDNLIAKLYSANNKRDVAYQTVKWAAEHNVGEYGFLKTKNK